MEHASDRFDAHVGGPFPSLLLAAAALTLSVCAFGVDVAAHGRPLLSWFDLNIYDHVGVLARHDPGAVYEWRARGRGFTYTPFAALLFAAFSELPRSLTHWLMLVASLGALGATVWLTLGELDSWRPRRVPAALALTACLLWTEPVLKALKLGQVELLLMALVVYDLRRPDSRRWKGTALGLAAAIKLTPLIFVAYLALVGSRRAAGMAAAVFAATAAVGAVLLPKASDVWWLHGRMFHAGFVTGVGSRVNQSLLGLLSRAAGSVGAATPAWLALAAVVGVVGLGTAVALNRSGLSVAGWSTCALTGLLISPISWDHHWVWIVPILLCLIDAAVRLAGRARRLALVATGVVAALFGGWPRSLSGPDAFVPGNGLLGSPPSPNMLPAKPGWLHALDVIGSNLFVGTGIVLLVLAGVAAVRLRAVRLAPVPAYAARSSG